MGSLPTPLVALCAGIIHSTLLLLPEPQKCSYVFGLFVSFHTLLHLGMQAVIFSSLYFLCILLLQEMFVQVQALQQGVPLPGLSLDDDTSPPRTAFHQPCEVKSSDKLICSANESFF